MENTFHFVHKQEDRVEKFWVDAETYLPVRVASEDSTMAIETEYDVTPRVEPVMTLLPEIPHGFTVSIKDRRSAS